MMPVHVSNVKRFSPILNNSVCGKNMYNSKLLDPLLEDVFKL